MVKETIIKIHLSDEDVKLLNTDMPEASNALKMARRDIGYCGCPEERELEAECQKYRDANIYDYMVLKQNIKNALRSGELAELKYAYEQYKKIPIEVRSVIHDLPSVDDIERFYKAYEALCHKANVMMEIAYKERKIINNE